MSVGKNLQYLRQLGGYMTQGVLAEKLNASRRTISKWEKPLSFARYLAVFSTNCFREDTDKRSGKYTNLRIEEVAGFRYTEYAVISTEPEGDAIDRILQIAKENGDENPGMIGWDFPELSLEQINVE